jgi:hypothetical protein
MIVNSGNTLTTNSLQPQIMQSKSQQVTFQQPQFIQQQDAASGNVVMRIIKEESASEFTDGSGTTKLPPWKRNSMLQHTKSGQQPQVITTTGGIPIFQINGQMIAIDQQNQNLTNQPQQIQIIEQKSDGEKTIIRR